MMTVIEPGAHILVFPFPAQGHMLPLLDLTHQLALRNLTITILVTPNNFHYLNPLITNHPASIHPLVFPFAANSNLPAGVENIRDLLIWKDISKRNDPSDDNEMINFSKIPNCPSYPWWKIPPGFRNYVEGHPQSEALRDSFMGNIPSHGLVFNSFNNLEQVYLDYMQKFLGHVRIWAVGSLRSRNWEGIYCEGLVPTGIHTETPSRGSVSNSLWVELCTRVIVSGVQMLTWPMRVDQFSNADLLDKLELGTRVCEGAETIPNSDELACLVARSVSDEKRVRIASAKEFGKAALDSIEKDGSSYRALDSLVSFLSNP
ncbi:hypothetical protein POM88_048885 [Heracleum sosnowskyi]|uniref:Uncharacterized protein n=1 Tax=Heracleum sosnowskyi TaxID=360622 RepID=A0AAD8GW32_9APIA|nr:hypothetical protein POM88_048885 [Heracleum sosnowskyi]